MTFLDLLAVIDWSKLFGPRVPLPPDWSNDMFVLNPAPTATDVYNARIDAYSTRATNFAKQQEVNAMPPSKILFSVHIATNGYYAVSDSGITVVSTTLSEVCIAMQAALADEAARSDTDAVVKAMSDWQKVT